MWKSRAAARVVPFLAAAFVLLVGGPGVTSVWSQTKRQLDSHEHGAGKLSIAIEGGKIELELEVPGDDIVGFEHKAKTVKQKAAVEQATKTLAAGLTQFKLPAVAGCKLESAKVELHFEAAEKKPAETKATTEDGHTEFRATYVLACAAPDKVTEIAFDYFKSFKNAQKLAVTVVSDKGQKHYEVTRKAPRLTLGGKS